MSIDLIATKLVVRDICAAEGFYRALGLKLVSRNLGGEDAVRQEQSWLSTGDAGAHMLILSRFTELAPPSRCIYPGEAWLAFRVDDVDGVLKSVEAAGGTIVRAGQDRPEHGVRAAIVGDPEGHIIEIVGPMTAQPNS